MLDWPLEGLLFDVENNNLWWQEWGERPGGPAARAEVLRDIVRSAPKLVPLVSHRYLPCEPNEAGNPVFSIHQSDVVYYGSNLEDYFAREFENTPSLLVGSPKHIRFWSTLVERNG